MRMKHFFTHLHWSFEGNATRGIICMSAQLASIYKIAYCVMITVALPSHHHYSL